MTATTRKRRRYTDEQRERIVADAKQLGVSAAAERHGVPQSCVSRWVGQVMRDAGVGRSATPEQGVVAAPVERVEAVAEPVAARRKRMPAKRYTPSQKAAIVEHANAHGVSAAAEKFQVSRFSIYGWLQKVDAAAKGQGPSPTSGPSATEIEAQRDREILAEWHKHPGLGPSQVVNQLRRGGVKVSVHTARQVMT